MVNRILCSGLAWLRARARAACLPLSGLENPQQVTCVCKMRAHGRAVAVAAVAAVAVAAAAAQWTCFQHIVQVCALTVRIRRRKLTQAHKTNYDL